MQLAESTILSEVIASSEAANMPASFIKHIRLEVEGDKIQVVNDWKYEDKYGKHFLARYFEFGTPVHYIAPKFARKLRFKSEGPEMGHGRALYSKRYDTEEGDEIFSSGHYVTGLPRTEAMSKGFEIGVAKFKTRLLNALL